MKKNPSITIKLGKKKKKRKGEKDGTLKTKLFKVQTNKVKCTYCNLKYVAYGHKAYHPDKIYGHTCARCEEVRYTIKSFRDWKGKNELTPKLLKKLIKELIK